MSTDGTTPEDNGGRSDDVEFDIEVTPMPRGRLQLSFRQGDVLRHRDVLNPNREDDRRKVRNAIAAKLGVSAEAVEGRLIDLIATLESRPEEEPADEAGDPAEAAAGSDAQRLLALADEVDLFHTAAGKAYATVSISGHPETFPLASQSYRQWWAREFRNLYGRPPGMEALGQARLVLEADAMLARPTREVYVRVAEVIDPADPDHPAYLYWNRFSVTA
jgi:hypothetical protein